MKKRNKTIIESVIICGIIATVTIGIIYNTLNKDPAHDCTVGYTWESDPNRLNFPETRTNLTLIVNYKNGTIEEYKEIDLNNHYTTVFDLVNKCCTIEYTIYCWSPISLFITRINNIGVGWIYKVNDYMTPSACNTVSPLDDSIIYWEFVGPGSGI
jgi:hypothetical protein